MKRSHTIDEVDAEIATHIQRRDELKMMLYQHGNVITNSREIEDDIADVNDHIDMLCFRRLIAGGR